MVLIKKSTGTTFYLYGFTEALTALCMLPFQKLHFWIQHICFLHEVMNYSVCYFLHSIYHATDMLVLESAADV